MTSDKPALNAPFANVEELLRASMAQSAKDSVKGGYVTVYEFADPRFKDYLIRVRGLNHQLNQTSSLTPVNYIFHGPNIGQPLLQSEGTSPNTALPKGTPAAPEISIMLKQPGDPLEILINRGEGASVIKRIIKNADSLERLYRTVALVGAFNKTIENNKRLYGYEKIDVHDSNILLAEDGTLGVIDQTSTEDIAKNPHSKLTFEKATNSRFALTTIFVNIILRTKISSAKAMAPSKIVESICNSVRDQLDLAEQQPNLNAQLAYLQNHLSPKGEHWLGVQPVVTRETTDERLKNPVFGEVTHVQATALDIRTASPDALLATLNEMKGACLDARGR